MLQRKQVKSVLNKHKKRDNWFLDDYSINPYEGCSCNCLYCYIRGSKYGENMSERLAVKANAIGVLDKQLAARAKKNQFGFVAVGSATDAYIHQEAQEGMTKQMLAILLKHRFPVFISTRQNLITRDIDLLREIDRQAILPADLAATLGRGLILSVSISTLNESVSNMLEPGACTPRERLNIVSVLKQAGFLVGVNAMPLLPYISDSSESIEEIIFAAKEAGADYILAAGLTLFGTGMADSKTLYYKFLQKYDEKLLPKYEQLFGKQFYQPFWYQQQLKEKFSSLCIKHAIRNSIL